MGEVVIPAVTAPWNFQSAWSRRVGGGARHAQEVGMARRHSGPYTPVGKSSEIVDGMHNISAGDLGRNWSGSTGGGMGGPGVDGEWQAFGVRGGHVVGGEIRDHGVVVREKLVMWR